MKAVIYQDLIDENLHGYQIKEAPDDDDVLLIKQGVIPGLFGYEPLHITHLTDGNILIIAQTDYELSIAKRKSIIKGAIAFLNPNNQNK